MLRLGIQGLMVQGNCWIVCNIGLRSQDGKWKVRNAGEGTIGRKRLVLTQTGTASLRGGDYFWSGVVHLC